MRECLGAMISDVRNLVLESDSGFTVKMLQNLVTFWQSLCFIFSVFVHSESSTEGGYR